MKKFTGLFFTLSIACVQLLHAQSADKKLQLSLSTGYQQQNFHWSIAGNSNGQSPNVFSELKWKNVGGQTIATSAQYNIWQKVYLYADYNRQFTTSGTINDNDYSGDNRTNATYNKTFNADKGNTYDWKIGAGYNIINNSNFSLTPYAGYGISGQSLFIYDKSGNFSTLNSTYQPVWKGAFVKVAAAFKISTKFKFNADATYNQVTYNSKADWNLIQTFQHPVSYRHHANGYGIIAGGRFVYDITSHVSVHIGCSYFSWQTGAGTDELYLNSGEVDKTQLNEAVRNGFQFFGGIGFGW